MASLIPKVVHRIWFGPHLFRDELVAYGKAWERHGYTVCHWTEHHLPELVNQQVYDEIGRRNVNTGCAPRHLGVWTQRADVVSLELVYRYGGIYANCDIEPLRPLDDLLHDVECFAGWEVEDQAVCNAIFGATKGHPFIKACIDRLPSRFYDPTQQTMQVQTGPGLITAVRADMASEITVFDRHIFYPYGFEQMSPEVEAAEYPQSYTSHHWGHRRG